MATKERKRPSARSERPTEPRTRRQERRKRRPEDPQIVYTQPPAFNRTGFLIRLATVAAVVLALTLGMSIFFKVEKVTVSGNEKYSAWDVRQASGIQEGENLLTINKAKIVSKIQAQLPYADKIRVGIKLPYTVNIEIVELDVAYAIQEDGPGWWLMNADGKLLEAITEAQAQGYTRILGVKIAGPQVGAQAVAVEQTQADEQTSEPEESTEPSVPVIEVRGSERLALAISILQSLENNGIMGTVNVVDVSVMTQLTLRYDNRYDVTLGDGSALNTKIEAMKKAAQQTPSYQTGTLDVSFTTWPDTVIIDPAGENEP